MSNDSYQISWGRAAFSGLAAVVVFQAFTVWRQINDENPMPIGSDNEKSLLVRTSFDNPEAWQAARRLAQTQPPELVELTRRLANISDDPESMEELKAEMVPCAVIDDKTHDGAGVPELLPMASKNGNGIVLFVFDEHSASHPERPLLVINLLESDKRFRALPGLTYVLQNHLVATRGLVWELFEDGLDEDGVYRAAPSQ